MAANNTIKCPLCGQGTLKDTVQDYNTTVKDGDHYKHIVIKDLTVELCSNCKEILLPKESLERVHSEKHKIRGLLSTAQLKNLRQDLGLTQTKMAELLGLGKKSYLRWESGASLQSKSMDRYLRLLISNSANVSFLKKLE